MVSPAVKYLATSGGRSPTSTTFVPNTPPESIPHDIVNAMDRAIAAGDMAGQFQASRRIAEMEYLNFDPHSLPNQWWVTLKPCIKNKMESDPNYLRKNTEWLLAHNAYTLLDFDIFRHKDEVLETFAYSVHSYESRNPGWLSSCRTWFVEQHLEPLLECVVPISNTQQEGAAVISPKLAARMCRACHYKDKEEIYKCTRECWESITPSVAPHALPHVWQESLRQFLLCKVHQDDTWTMTWMPLLIHHDSFSFYRVPIHHISTNVKILLAQNIEWLKLDSDWMQRNKDWLECCAVFQELEKYAPPSSVRAVLTLES